MRNIDIVIVGAGSADIGMLVEIPHLTVLRYALIEYYQSLP